jgi:hypothetical protein
MSFAADDFDAIRKAMTGVSCESCDEGIAADDLEDGQDCHRRCGGRLDASRDKEIGCSCHICPPCGACCPGVLTCSCCKEVFRYERG